MAKFKVVKGRLEEQPEETGAAEVTKSNIIERYKPAADAINAKEWVPFPEVDLPITPPPAPWVLIQKRASRNKTAGGILTASESQEIDGFRERVGKLLAVGKGCYRNIDGTPSFGVPFEDWPQPGSMVVMPMSGGSEFKRKAKDGTEVTITAFHWRDVVGVVKDVAL